MKKITIILIVLIAMIINTKAQTNVSGFISSNTTWTTAGSPYIIVGNTLLDSGFVLTIDPGVIIKFDSNKSLQISGSLRAIGTSVNPVTFTSNASSPAPGDWHHILFNNNSADYDYTLLTGSIMEYCIVEYGGGSTNGTIQLNGAYPFINYCTIRNNANSGIASAWELYLSGTEFITNSVFSNNASPTNGGGINLGLGQWNSNIVNILNCTFSNNSALAGGAIALNGNSLTSGQNTISGNTISNNSASGNGGGIFIYGGGYATTSNNIIYGNTAGVDGGGIYTGYSSYGGTFGAWGSGLGIIKNNIIYNNSATIDGGGISEVGTAISNNVIALNSANGTYGAVFMPSFGDSITRNHIIDNTAPDGIVTFSNDVGNYNYNTITRNTTTNIAPTSIITIGGSNNCSVQANCSNNNLYGNKATYEFQNQRPQSCDINMKNSWWGTTSTATIDNEIYDYFNDGTLSIVYYNPIQTSPDITAPVTPPVNIIKTDVGGGNIHLTWNANPETDIAGYKIYWGSPTGYSFANFVDVSNITAYTLSGVSISDSIAVTAYDTQMNGVEDQFEGHESWYTYAVGVQTPAFSASSTVVCPADTVFFSANTPETYSYAGTTWSWAFEGGSPSVSNAENPNVIYNTSGVYYVKLKVTNIAGSDSITYLNYITVNQVSYGNISPALCNIGNYTSPSGLYTWYSSGTYHDTIPNQVGCDSILTINLTLSYDSYASIFPVSCNSYVSPSGNNIWISSGTYYDTIPNYLGCDSIFSIYLTVYIMDTSVTINGNMLTSNASGVSYQWLNCSNGFSVIPGENNQSYAPAVSGNFAVEITQSSCADTSSCYQVISVGINAFNQNKATFLYPNPASDIITLNLGNTNNTELTLSIYSVLGKLIRSETIRKNQQQINVGDLNNGIYMVEIKSESWTEKQKLIIQR